MYSVYLSASVQEKNVGIDGIPEETRMQELAKDIAAILSTKGLAVYLNRPEWSLGEIIEDSNNKVPNLHLALHSNAGGGSGVETWCYRTSGTKSAAFGAKLQDAVIRAIGLPNRGLKDAGVAGQIKGEVVRTHATACLIELFFHDNAGDLAAFNHNRQRVIDAIVAVVLDWFEIKSTTSHAEKTMDFAVINGWIKDRRNPHAMPEWHELIDFMRNVLGK